MRKTDIAAMWLRSDDAEGSVPRLIAAFFRISCARTCSIEEFLATPNDVLRLLLIDRLAAELRCLEHGLDLSGQCVAQSGP